MAKKKVLLAVCGSISFYKSFEILSRLKKENFDVYVMLSEGALKFVNYKAYEALCDHPVLCSQTEDWQEGVNHIEYAKVDLVLIAPASVNTINKLAWGVCDNVFMQTLIATKAQLVIAPAANTKMLENPITKNCIEILQNKTNAILIDPVEKTLACGEFGKGALPEPKMIVSEVKRAIYEDKFYKNKLVVITGGPTIEKIDNVRGITNFSSGKLAKALADAFYYLGAEVILISSIEYDELPYKLVKFESSIGLKSALESTKFRENSYLVMAAAVSDYIPKVRYKEKMKKEEIGEIWNLRLGLNDDIISSFRAMGVKKIGFKLETDKENALNGAKKMLNEKGLDAVCLNVLDDVVKFGGDVTRITYITKTGETEIKTATKNEVAFQIAKLTKSL